MCCSGVSQGWERTKELKVLKWGRKKPQEQTVKVGWLSFASLVFFFHLYRSGVMLRLPSMQFLTGGVSNPEWKLVKGRKQRDESSDLLLARSSTLVQFSKGKYKTTSKSFSESIQSRKGKLFKTARKLRHLFQGIKAALFFSERIEWDSDMYLLMF